MEKLVPGTLDANFLMRSEGRIGGSAHAPLLTPPAKDAPIKEWFKKFFCLKCGGGQE